VTRITEQLQSDLDLLRVPALRGLALADVCARLPQGMVTITLLLVVAAHASMTTAGLAVTGYTLGQAVTGPARGRLADRRGLAVVCAVCGALYAVALLGLLAASLARAPAAALIAAAAVAGVGCPPLSPGMRSLWSAHAADPLRQAAFALDAAVFDLAYITGPVLASSLAAGLSPAAAVGVLLALTAAGTVLIGTGLTGTGIIVGRSRPITAPAGHDRGSKPGNGPAAQARRPLCPASSPRFSGRLPDRGSSAAHIAADDPRSRRGLLGPLDSPALRRLLLTGALANAALSATEVALTGYLRQHHVLWASGPLLAEVSVGSIAGSLLLGARAAGASASDERRRLPWLLACYALGLAALAAAALQPPLVAVAAPVAGLCLGPTLATLFGLASSAVPGGGTETQAWLNSAMNGGAAAGAALAGLTAGAPALSLAVTAGVAALAAGTAVAGRVTDRPATYTEFGREEAGQAGRDYDQNPVDLNRPSSGPGRLKHVKSRAGPNEVPNLH
jgi:MFS family permease